MGYRKRVAAVAATFSTIVLLTVSQPANADSAEEINAKSRAALNTLYSSVPGTDKIAEAAKGIMVFPDIVKGGLIVGGAYGEGELREHGRVSGYYTSVSASFGLQIGATQFGYIMFFMDNDSLNYVKRTDGWEVGIGPNLTAGDQSFARKFTTTTMEPGVVVYFVNQDGLFAGAGIEGTKITRK